jgi:hypothetical protein
MLTPVKSKQSLIKALNQRELTVDGGFEVVNEANLRSMTGKVRNLLRRRKKLHIVILERP